MILPKLSLEALADSTVSGLVAETTLPTSMKSAIGVITAMCPPLEEHFCPAFADPTAQDQDAVTVLSILSGVTSTQLEPNSEVNNANLPCLPNTANKTAHGTVVTEDSTSTKLAITEL